MSLQENCSICFEDYVDPIKLPCNHIFVETAQQLLQKQSCPICRRLCCNYINSPFLSITEPEERMHEHQGEPCFVYRITLHHNALTQFNFFEKRYVEMITEVLKNLTFIIDPQYNDCCMRVKLVECVPVHEHSIYVCTVQNIQRLKIIGFSERKYRILILNQNIQLRKQLLTILTKKLYSSTRNYMVVQIRQQKYCL